MIDNEKKDRIKGMLWGLIVGDCLGSPVQFMKMDSFPPVTEMQPCLHFNTPPGHWTDDGAMALCIMESAVSSKGYDLEDIADCFISWFDEGYCSSLEHAFDIGNATLNGIYKLKEGHLCNGSEESQGNGSIMRFAPTLLLNGDDPKNRIIHEISDLTHHSSKIRETIDLMAEICREHLKGIKTSHQSEYNLREEVNNSGWAVSTLQAALWAFHKTKNFEDALVEAVNLGGDADTIGAVCGQISGAYYGYSAIPERWLAVIKDREKLDKLIDNFIEICDHLPPHSVKIKKRKSDKIKKYLKAIIPAAAFGIGILTAWLWHDCPSLSPQASPPEQKKDSFFESWLSRIGDEDSCRWIQERSCIKLYDSMGLVSFEFVEWGYYGGAHGHVTTKVGTMYRGKLLRIADLPKLDSGLDKIQKMFQQALKSHPEFESIKSYSGENIKMTENFYIDDEGIHFIYDPYEISAYASGTVEILVPYTIFGAK